MFVSERAASREQGTFSPTLRRGSIADHTRSFRDGDLSGSMFLNAVSGPGALRRSGLPTYPAKWLLDNLRVPQGRTCLLQGLGDNLGAFLFHRFPDGVDHVPSHFGCSVTALSFPRD